MRNYPHIVQFCGDHSDYIFFVDKNFHFFAIIIFSIFPITLLLFLIVLVWNNSSYGTMVANISIYYMVSMFSCVFDLSVPYPIYDFLIWDPLFLRYSCIKHRNILSKRNLLSFPFTHLPFGHTTLDTWQLPVEAWLCRVFQDMVNLLTFQPPFRPDSFWALVGLLEAHLSR